MAMGMLFFHDSQKTGWHFEITAISHTQIIQMLMLMFCSTQNK